MPLVDYSDSDDEDNGIPAEPPPEETTLKPKRDDDGASQAILKLLETTALQQPLIQTTALKRKRSDDEAPPKATSKLPPLPAAFLDLYTTEGRLSTRDDPSLHGGRKRNIPHKQGNWIAHVYLDWYPTAAESETLSDLIALLQAPDTTTILPGPLPKKHTPKIHSSLYSALGTPLPLHISLSRSLVLLEPQCDPFRTTLRSHLSRSAVRPFDIEPTALKWVPNYERTRWFLVLSLNRPEGGELNKLLDACNAAARDFKQPELYVTNPPKRGKNRDKDGTQARRERSRSGTPNIVAKDREERFHISIAWTLEDPGSVDIQALSDQDVQAVRATKVRFEEVKVKVGKVVTVIPFDKKTANAESSSAMLGL